MAGVINVVVPFAPKCHFCENPRNKLKGENKTMELVVGRGPQQEAASRLQAHNRGGGHTLHVRPMEDAGAWVGLEMKIRALSRKIQETI